MVDGGQGFQGFRVALRRSPLATIGRPYGQRRERLSPRKVLGFQVFRVSPPVKSGTVQSIKVPEAPEIQAKKSFTALPYGAARRSKATDS